MKLIDIFTIQKFRFDIAIQFIVFLNFALLCITASPQVKLFIENVIKVSVNQYFLIAVMVVISFFTMWLFGYVLDKMGYWQSIRTVQTDRDPLMQELQLIKSEIQWLKDQHIKNIKD